MSKKRLANCCWKSERREDRKQCWTNKHYNRRMKQDNWKENRPGLGRRTANTCKLTDTQHANAFSLTFQQQMETYGVDPQYWVAKLMPFLDGRSTTMLLTLPAEDKNNFTKVKLTLLALYGIGLQAFRLCWQQLKLKTSETCYELAQRAQLLFLGWTDGISTWEALVDWMVTEKMLQTIPDRIHTWVRDQKPTTPDRQGRLADEHLCNLTNQVHRGEEVQELTRGLSTR